MTLTVELKNYLRTCWLLSDSRSVESDCASRSKYIFPSSREAISWTKPSAELAKPQLKLNIALKASEW
ncbi:MAG: hypothetical protein ACTS6A_03085 [Candidatus Hodgkinia cicadicola]